MNQTLTIRIPDELREGLEEISKAEKKPISDKATAGVYYFRKGIELLDNLDVMIAADISFQGEYYISPVYNQYIKENKKIRNFPVAKVWSLKTPEDVENFKQNYSHF